MTQRVFLAVVVLAGLHALYARDWDVLILDSVCVVLLLEWIRRSLVRKARIERLKEKTLARSAVED